MSPAAALGRVLLELAVTVSVRMLQGPESRPGDASGARFLLLAAMAAAALLAAPGILVMLLTAGLAGAL